MMKRLVLCLTVMAIALAASAQYVQGQYLVCVKKGGVVLRTGPGNNKPEARIYDEPAIVYAPTDDIPEGVVFYIDKGMKYLGKKQNGYLYVEATRDGDIFDDEVVKAWIPEKYVKAACKKCKGLGYYIDSDYSTCPKCKGRGY